MVSEAEKESRDNYSIHWVEGPENQSETRNGSEEGTSLLVSGLCRGTAVYSKLVDDHKVGNASDGVVSPLLSTLVSESSEEASQNHDQISNDGDEDVSTAQSSEEGKVEEQERGRDTPVDVASPVHLAVDVLSGVGSVLVGFLDDNVVIRDAVTGSHCEVRDGSESGDEGSQDVEKAFLLCQGQLRRCRGRITMLTTGTRKAIT